MHHLIIKYSITNIKCLCLKLPFGSIRIETSFRYQETDWIGGKASSKHGQIPIEPRINVKFFVWWLREAIGGSSSLFTFYKLFNMM